MPTFPDCLLWGLREIVWVECLPYPWEPAGSSPHPHLFPARKHTSQGEEVFLNAGGLLTGAVLFLLQRPCPLETHNTFLFSPHTNQPIQMATSPQTSPRYDLRSVSSVSPGPAVQQETLHLV